ncbi:MAG: DUF2786 domain-containing protein [Phytobacter diazotrophicus]|uniref:DUF7168 domain-containing protein n=1 Tax=Phytobacter sp. MRY16-398 TaxID=2487150 RepID=UPI000DF5E1B3|nr:DUF2786 domain-containing protein [Phytobacter sp. MRY16-398]MBS6740068.1 DUF2786 domain-containing protein [Enterobacteriaceae bacterium]MDU4355613.1 DUF2786 domain-containing protein [Phytobacter diazotrophicus]BBE75751.1 hypothetical protein MRY16398_08070 [Phytobacter sp. MRY16-398]
MHDDLKLMQRIQRLMALGTRNSNQHEAARALALAQRLMLRHNLSAEMLAGAEIREAVCYNLVSNASKVPAWLSSLATVVCMASGCRCWFGWHVHTTAAGHQRQRRSVHFYGFRERPSVAQYIFTVLQRQLRISTERHMATYKGRRILLRTLRSRADQFREGWVTGVWLVLKSFAPTGEESSALQHWLSHRLKDNPTIALTVREAKACRGDQSARIAGWVSGSNAEIHHGLNGGRALDSIGSGEAHHD